MAQLPCIGLSYSLTKPPFGGCADYFPVGIYMVGLGTSRYRFVQLPLATLAKRNRHQVEKLAKPVASGDLKGAWSWWCFFWREEIELVRWSYIIYIVCLYFIWYKCILFVYDICIWYMYVIYVLYVWYIQTQNENRLYNTLNLYALEW